MRLWHKDMLPILPRLQLLSQHREVCALRGKGWGKRHSTIDYIFKHHPDYLYNYHLKVQEEMVNRGYTIEPNWLYPSWRGKRLKHDFDFCTGEIIADYPEHNDHYLKECLYNLIEKIEIDRLDKTGKYTEQERMKIFNFLSECGLGLKMPESITLYYKTIGEL